MIPHRSTQEVARSQVFSFRSDQYYIETDIYQGPLDLLLDLIEKAELDITVLSLTQVTDPYLAHIQTIHDKNPSEVSVFIVITARLIQIKSARLLPRPPETAGDLDEDSAESLARQLILYKRFKDLSKKLAMREDAELRSWLRQKAPNLGFEPPLDLNGLNPHDLAQIAARILIQKKKIEKLSSVMRTPRITIGERIFRLINRLRTERNISFASLLDSNDKTETVVTFLAMLELIKQNMICVTQDENFSAIRISQLSEINHSRPIDSEFGE